MDKSEHTKQFLEKIPKQLSKPVDALEEPSIIEKQMVELFLIHLRRADGFFLKEENHFRVDTPWVEILSKFAKESPHILERALSSYLSEHIKEFFEENESEQEDVEVARFKCFLNDASSQKENPKYLDFITGL